MTGQASLPDPTRSIAGLSIRSNGIGLHAVTVRKELVIMVRIVAAVAATRVAIAEVSLAVAVVVAVFEVVVAGVRDVGAIPTAVAS